MLSPQDISIIKDLIHENNLVLEERFQEIDRRFDWLGHIIKRELDQIDERFADLEAIHDKDVSLEEAWRMFGIHDQRISRLEDTDRMVKTKLGI